MTIRRVSPTEAQDLMTQEGYVYVDVRSVPEFEAGHPAGAYNVPLAHLGPRGMAPNPDFLATMEAHFAKDARLVIGCQSGGRSLQAATLLERLGFQNLVDQRAGFQGAGGEPGWRPAGLPVATEAAPDRTWDGLKGGA